MYDSSEQRYKLSGIAQDLGDKFKYAFLPLDSGKFMFGDPTGMEPDLVEMHHDFLDWWFEDLTPKYDWHKFAVSIHMRCWVLAQQVIGSKIHDNLELFLAVSLMKASAWEYVYGDSPPWEENENVQGKSPIHYILCCIILWL